MEIKSAYVIMKSTKTNWINSTKEVSTHLAMKQQSSPKSPNK